MDKKLLERLKALLAMSKDKSSEKEAMIAAKRLHSLLAKHNVSLTELEDKEEQVDYTRTKYKCRPWKRRVAMYVAELYFCEFLVCRVGKGVSQYAFIGKEHDRMFASFIFDMIVKVLEKESRKQSKEMYGKEVPSFVNSFWTGASTRIIERCKELIKLGKEGNLQDEEGNTLPVLLDLYERSQIANVEFLDANFNHKPMKARTKVTDLAGERRGKLTGDKVQLSRALQGESSPKLLTSN